MSPRVNPTASHARLHHLCTGLSQGGCGAGVRPRSEGGQARRDTSVLWEAERVARACADHHRCPVRCDSPGGCSGDALVGRLPEAAEGRVRAQRGRVHAPSVTCCFHLVVTRYMYCTFCYTLGHTPVCQSPQDVPARAQSSATPEGDSRYRTVSRPQLLKRSPRTPRAQEGLAIGSPLLWLQRAEGSRKRLRK